VADFGRSKRNFRSCVGAFARRMTNLFAERASDLDFEAARELVRIEDHRRLLALFDSIFNGGTVGTRLAKFFVHERKW